MTQKRWKVVALRNGVAEAMVFDASWVTVHSHGSLSVERDVGNGYLDVLHIFAPGRWLEAVPLESAAEEKK